jgi:hypothetical protein
MGAMSTLGVAFVDGGSRAAQDNTVTRAIRIATRARITAFRPDTSRRLRVPASRSAW